MTTHDNGKMVHLELYSLELSVKDLEDFLGEVWGSAADSARSAGLTSAESKEERPRLSSGLLGHIELHDTNVLKGVSGLSGLELRGMDMVCGRLFDGAKQVKFRRMRDDRFRLAADAPLGGWGWSPVFSGEVLAGKRSVALWGYKSEDPRLGSHLYEERIPRLFRYPAAVDLQAGERLAMHLEIFEDLQGNLVWDRFTHIEKWVNDDDGLE